MGIGAPPILSQFPIDSASIPDNGRVFGVKSTI